MMMNWNVIFLQSFRELFGLLGAVILILFFLHYAVHSPALESIIVSIVEPLFFSSSSSTSSSQQNQQQNAGMLQMILTPISILRLVSQKALEDEGSIWLGAVIVAVAFLGATFDFVLGNFCRHLAVAVGVRLDAIELMNAEWDVAAVAQAGSKGSDGKSGYPPTIPIVQQQGVGHEQQQQIRRDQLPHNRLTAENNMGVYKPSSGPTGNQSTAAGVKRR